jgi:hypothetical protein
MMREVQQRKCAEHRIREPTILDHKITGSLLGALCPSKSGLMNKHIVKHIVKRLVGFSFNASLEPQPRAAASYLGFEIFWVSQG